MTALERYRPWPAAITAPSQAALRREIGRAHRRGELAASGPIYQIRGGRYAVDVLRLRPRRRVPVWAVVVGAGVTLLVVAGAVGWWLSTALPALLPVGAGVGLLYLAVRRRAGGGGHGCTITHTTRH